MLQNIVVDLNNVMMWPLFLFEHLYSNNGGYERTPKTCEKDMCCGKIGIVCAQIMLAIPKFSS